MEIHSNSPKLYYGFNKNPGSTNKILKEIAVLECIAIDRQDSAMHLDDLLLF